MSRPDDRPLRRLPQLQAKKATFERCVFCPKLCRSACPVSNAEPRETLTPWGKMSMAYFVANESVPLEDSFADPAWACTGCFGCREHCDHKNDVAGTLFESRAAIVAAGRGPRAARRVIAKFKEKAAGLGKTAKDSRVSGFVDSSPSAVAVLIGCEHARRGTDAGLDTIRSVARLLDAKVAVVDVCCGAPLLYAGDDKAFRQQGEILARAIKHHPRVVVGDAGCLSTIRVHASMGVGGLRTAAIEHLTELVLRDVSKLKRLPALSDRGPIRWHDPCQLGRGLGLYDPPRQILSRIIGRAPDEFERHHDDARCSGAGGLLPVTMPDVARSVAEQRLADHVRSGGGTVVTACASSMRSFKKADPSVDVVDLATLIARALE